MSEESINGSEQFTEGSAEENRTSEHEEELRDVPEGNASAGAPLQVLEEIKEILGEQNRLYQEKIHRDEYLQGLNDKLYADLRTAQGNAAEKKVDSVMNELILVIRDSEKQLKKLPDEASPESYAEAKKRFSGVIRRLEDILQEQDIESYSVAGDKLVPSRQEVTGVVETNDESLRNCVAEHVEKGFIKYCYSENGDTSERVLRKEKVIAYKLTDGGEV